MKKNPTSGEKTEAPPAEPRFILHGFIHLLLDLLAMSLLAPLTPFIAESHGAGPASAGLLTASFSLASLLTSPLLGHLSDLGERRRRRQQGQQHPPQHPQHQQQQQQQQDHHDHNDHHQKQKQHPLSRETTPVPAGRSGSAWPPTRRQTLALCSALTCATHVLLPHAQSLAQCFALRLAAGACGGSAAVARAYLADATPAQEVDPVTGKVCLSLCYHFFFFFFFFFFFCARIWSFLFLKN
jgi:MFS family permease